MSLTIIKKFFFRITAMMSTHSHEIFRRIYLKREQVLNPVHRSIESPSFGLTNSPTNQIEYSINVHPNGRTTAEMNRFLVFLKVKFPPNLRVYANYNFIVAGVIQRNFQHSFVGPSSFGGILCARQVLLSHPEMFINDRLSIELSGQVFVQKISPHLQNRLIVRGNLPPVVRAHPPQLHPPDMLSRMPAVPVPNRNNAPTKTYTKHKIIPLKTPALTPATTTEQNIVRILENAVQEEKNAAKKSEEEKKKENTGKKIITPKKRQMAQKRIISVVDAVESNTENVDPAATTISTEILSTSQANISSKYKNFD